MHKSNGERNDIYLCFLVYSEEFDSVKHLKLFRMFTTSGIDNIIYEKSKLILETYCEFKSRQGNIRIFAVG